jgi:hypothetical protein
MVSLLFHDSPDMRLIVRRTRAPLQAPIQAALQRCAHSAGSLSGSPLKIVRSWS